MKKLITAIFCFLFISFATQAQQQVWQNYSIDDGGSYQIREIVTTNNKIFYPIYNIDQISIAVTDNSNNNTLILKKFDEVTNLTVFNNKVFFIGGSNDSSALWMTDGTIAGTIQLTPDTSFVRTYSYAVLNNRLYFTSANSIWYTDGTASGTKILVSIPDTDTFIYTLAALNDKLIFFYSGKLGVTDGISSTIHFLSDKTSQPITNAYVYLQPLKDNVLFICSTPDTGMELWSTDGTDANTGLFLDINPGNADGFPIVDHSLQTWFTASNGNMYFVADDGAGSNIWVTDGTLSGTSKLYKGAIAYNPVSLKSIDGNVYFSNNYSTGFYFSDGKNNTVYNISGNGNPSDAYSFVKYHDSIYFVAYDPDHGYELWKTGNTPESTVRVTDICPGDCDAFNHYTGLIACNNSLFFSASNTNTMFSDNYQLWELTTQTTSTAIIKNSSPVTNAYPNPCEDFIAIEIPSQPSNVTIVSSVGTAGKALWKYENNQVIVNTQSYVPGMYKVVIDGYEPVSVIKK